MSKHEVIITFVSMIEFGGNTLDRCSCIFRTNDNDVAPFCTVLFLTDPCWKVVCDLIQSEFSGHVIIIWVCEQHTRAKNTSPELSQ